MLLDEHCDEPRKSVTRKKKENVLEIILSP